MDVPQFIHYDVREGKFRHARLNIERENTNYDLGGHISLAEEELVVGRDIELSGSTYMGPVEISEERPKPSMNTGGMYRLARFREEILLGIVGDAENHARRMGVPYFSINIVQSPRNKGGKFFRSEFQNPQITWQKPIASNQSDEPLEFILHPSVQLYVSKRREKPIIV